MKRLLPGRTEIVIFLVASVLFAAIAASSATIDLTLSGLSIPLFIGAALMGMRRNGQLSAVAQPVREQEPARGDAQG